MLSKKQKNQKTKGEKGMVKVNVTKLNKIKSLEPIDIKIGEETISVVQYLPLEKKLTV